MWLGARSGQSARAKKFAVDLQDFSHARSVDSAAGRGLYEVAHHRFILDLLGRCVQFDALRRGIVSITDRHYNAVRQRAPGVRHGNNSGAARAPPFDLCAQRVVNVVGTAVGAGVEVAQRRTVKSQQPPRQTEHMYAQGKESAACLSELTRPILVGSETIDAHFVGAVDLHGVL